MIALLNKIVFPHLWLNHNIWGQIAGAAIGAVGSYLGSKNDKKAASDTNEISEEAAKKTLGELDESWGDISSWLEPYMQTGEAALAKYRQVAGMSPGQPTFEKFDFDYTKMEDNPAYQFVRDQGLQAVDRLQAKNRNLGSGNRMTAAMDYASGLASTEYDNEFKRQLLTNQTNNQIEEARYGYKNKEFDRKLNSYGNLKDSGQNAAGNLSSFRDRLASDRSNAFANRAAEKGASTLLKRDANNQLIGTIAKGAGSIAGAYFA